MVEGEERVVEKPTFDAWIEAWTPGDTVDARQLKDKLPYRTWIEAGRGNGHRHGAGQGSAGAGQAAGDQAPPEGRP